MRLIVWLCISMLLTGCAGRGTTTSPRADAEIAQEDVLANVAARLRRDPSVSACRNLITQINGVESGEAAPPAVSEAVVSKLTNDFRLSPAESRELRRSEFTSLDAAELAECLLFRDASRSLEISKLPVDRQVDEAFAWTCRMIFLRDRVGSPAQTTFMAQRGSGDGLERGYVFLAILRQLGIRAALVGPEDLADRGTIQPFVRGQRAIARQSAWAIGVEVDGQLRLYDPWLGQPIRTAMGQPATMQTLRDQPESLKAWYEAAPQVETKSADALKKAAVVISPTLSAVAPRIARLEKILGAPVDVKMAVDVEALQVALTKLPGVGVVKPWGPKDDAGTLTHLMGQFLPVEDGGFDENPAGQEAFVEFMQQLVPWSAFPPEFNNLRGASRLRIRSRIFQQYQKFVLEPNNPHQMLLRGMYNDVIKELTAIREEAQRAASRANGDLGVLLAEWGPQIDAADADLARATRSKDPLAIQQAQAQLEVTFKSGEKALMLIDRLASEQLAHEATYLLCLTIQEKAERLTLIKNLDLASRIDAWQSSRDWWQRYLRDFPRDAAAQPGRLAHAQAMLVRVDEQVRKLKVP